MPFAFHQGAVPLGIALGVLALLLFLRGIAFKVFHRWALRTRSPLDDLIIRVIRFPSLFWCLIIALYVGINSFDQMGIPLQYTLTVIHLLLVFSVTLAISSLIGHLLRYYSQRSEVPLPSTGLVTGLLKGMVWAIGWIVILHFLGIPITPMITALGIGGLAVALALQDTLANLFAGVHIMVEKSIRVGDFVKLESGQEGHVLDITWRTTRIRMLSNNMVIIPNQTLSKSIVTNYYLPEKRMTLQIPVSVSYESDPDRVEAVLLETIHKAAGEIPGLLSEPGPVVRFIPGFGESSLDFTLICQIREVSDQFQVRHELHKRIYQALRKSGLEIPFPHRTVYLKTESIGQRSHANQTKLPRSDAS